MWHVKNVLLVFDNNGVVQSKSQVEDDALLWRELHACVPNLEPHDFSKPMSLFDDRDKEELTLTKDLIQLTRKGKPKGQVSANKIIRFRHEGSRNKRSDSGVTCHTLYLSEKTGLGRRLHFCAAAPQIVAVFQYLHQNGPKELLWE